MAATVPKAGNKTVRRVGIIMAGNIPLVGFFDLMCVLLSGHGCLYKPSSKDSVLIDHIAELLTGIDPSLPLQRMNGKRLDAVIATGSDNTNRYFRTIYHDMPALFRGSRHSIAVLTGDETPADLTELRQDIFTYFGMGCRNVSQLFLPRNLRYGAAHARFTKRPGHSSAIPAQLSSGFCVEHDAGQAFYGWRFFPATRRRRTRSNGKRTGLHPLRLAFRSRRLALRARLPNTMRRIGPYPPPSPGAFRTGPTSRSDRLSGWHRRDEIFTRTIKLQICCYNSECLAMKMTTSCATTCFRPR
ncbi:MAG: acyl-CoA reductase [Alistipes indistinctus]